MTTWLVVLTVFEVLLLVGVLAGYLIAIARRLESISGNLAKVSFGVRAIETQAGAIGPSVVRLNEELKAITGALPGIAAKAEQVAARSGR
ncbi:MAG: hypothetical protein Q8Q52_04180 [Acidimicrobiia bacterium]|nr:hypothetical protein [Acidimicrobiia bacterium]